MRWVQDGVELADNYCFDPHKWMLTNVDCTAMWVADRRPLIAALSVLPEYLRNPASESGSVIDSPRLALPLGRRFRALKLWLVLRWYGLEGLRAMVRRHVALAQDLARASRPTPNGNSQRRCRSTSSASATAAATRSTSRRWRR